LSAGLWGEALSSDFEKIANLVANGVLFPKFIPETFATEQAAAISACREVEDEIVERSRLHLLKQFFQDHPLGVSLAGTPESLQRIKTTDLAELHQQLVVAGNLVVGISGDFDRQMALELVKQRFGMLPKVPFVAKQLPKHQPVPAKQCKETATGEQAVVALAFPHCGFGPDQAVASNITEELLSGMASGLFRRVREEKGMAYFVGASRVEVVDQGMFYLFAGTAPNKAAEVMTEMQEELARLRAGKFSPTEIEDAKRSMRVSRRQARQAVGARLQGALLREVVGLGANFDAEWERRMDATDAKAIQRFAQEMLNTAYAQGLTVLPKTKA
jgi:zinc protease